jgi:hypothetical protein
MTFATSLEALADELRAYGVGANRVSVEGIFVVVSAVNNTSGLLISQRDGRWGAEFDWHLTDPELPATGNYEAMPGSAAWGPEEVLAWAYPLLVGHSLAGYKRPLHA